MHTVQVLIHVYVNMYRYVNNNILHVNYLNETFLHDYANYSTN